MAAVSSVHAHGPTGTRALSGAADVLVVGAGAAGLMAAISAGRAGARVVAVDGARTLGAKILVAGGGRCNVTHEHVDERDFTGSTPPAIRKVLRRFGVEDTRRFFAERGVALKRESTGKLFPVTDKARTVLDALLQAARAAGVELRHPFRVEQVARRERGFEVGGPAGRLSAARVILATGGRALPRSGSDGHGYVLARALGHTTTRHVFPALVPLTTPAEEPLRQLSGLAAPVALEVVSASGRRLRRVEGALLCTHFGFSGPAVLDASRHLLAARFEDPQAGLRVSWLPGESAASVEAALAGLGARTLGGELERRLPQRLAHALCLRAGLDPASAGARLTRLARRRLVDVLTALPLSITGDRGFTYAEATAGGVPLRELNLDTLESRVCPGLHLCGEICDVDGRLGGFNFQWAWASGFVAGSAAARAAKGET